MSCSTAVDIQKMESGSTTPDVDGTDKAICGSTKLAGIGKSISKAALYGTSVDVHEVGDRLTCTLPKQLVVLFIDVCCLRLFLCDIITTLVGTLANSQHVSCLSAICSASRRMS